MSDTENIPDAFLEVALEASRAAEKIILKYYGDDIRTTLKTDQSPVTIADEEAERAIVEIIHKAFPDHGILGEETGATEITAEYVWTIDPIDGTRNYLRQVPIFGTLIALMQKGEPILGVSNMPAMKECLWAVRGKGAFKDGVRLSVSTKDSLESAYVSYGGIGTFVQKQQVPQLLSLAGDVERLRGFGDCWQYHLLAEGKIDIVVDPKVHIWDIAAPKIIIEEAGGKLTTPVRESPFGKEQFMAIATNGHLHSEVLKHFER